MRITAHFLIHSALLLSGLWSAHPTAVHRSSILGAIHHADSADSFTGEPGSTFLTEQNTGVKNAETRGEGLEREKRLTGNKPTSLDLTFHMLRKLMETSRAERMSQKAKINKHLLKTLGKRSSQLFV
uniref:Corticotropin-releasing factor domain-containing protein n=1 Tax=Pygocentrus nattereri TaxID=42514 RepID=A0A3B4BUQ3_PYGNA